jgi:hypothetical protein
VGRRAAQYSIYLFARTAAVLETVWHYRDALGWSEWPRGAVPAQEDHPRPTATRARARPRRPRRRPARGEGGAKSHEHKYM